MMRCSTPRATPRRRSLRAGTFGLVSVLRAAWLSASLIAMADNSPVPHPKPPVAKTREHRSIWHGESVNDPWFWLREKTNPEVIGYLEAENAYMEASTVEAKAFGETLYKEMLGASSKPTSPSRSGAGLMITTLGPKRGGSMPFIAGGRRRRMGHRIPRPPRSFSSI